MRRTRGKGPALPAAGREGDDERRRLSTFHLTGLALGGIIGSGWVAGAYSAYGTVGSDAWLTWGIGGLVMLLVASVMVELGTAVPKTGGLIFLPLQSSGALVATVAAGGIWLVYAINLSSEAFAMTRALTVKSLRLVVAGPGPDPRHTDTELLRYGWLVTLLFMIVITAVNLIDPKVFFAVNSWLTVLKVGILVLFVVVFWTMATGSQLDHACFQKTPDLKGQPYEEIMKAVVSSSAIYAYVGFQGPLDFAGNVRRRGIGEAARLRIAVYGAFAGSALLYIALQFVYNHDHLQWSPNEASSPYVTLAGPTWLGWLLQANALISPMAAGLVFTHALTREVAALSRAHLTHRGLQSARMSSLGRRHDVYWLVLGVNLCVAIVALIAVRGSLLSLIAVSSVLTLVVYAIPSVVLAALLPRLRDKGYGERRAAVYGVLARLSFVLLTIVAYMVGWDQLWQGMAALAAGCALLFGLPCLARVRPAFGRMYDAKVTVTQLRHWRTLPAAQAALWLTAHLVALTLFSLLGKTSRPALDPWTAGCLLAVTSWCAFEGMVRASRRHMAQAPPILPAPGAVEPAAGPRARAHAR
ncbi:APC family permease [Streptomyces sp. NPDC101249]|uniref:APC family permease n=1 Tax=Streptomyces sp. NPDC101249 TaxID=3366140 RepID=UPI003814F55E